MSNRRIIGSERTILEKDDAPEEASDAAPAVPREVIVKLLAFTAAMVLLPIGSYFFTVRTIFGGNSTYAGGFAALVANVVLIAYIVVAMTEDESDQKKERNMKKNL